MPRNVNITIMTLKRLTRIISWRRPVYTQGVRKRIMSVSVFIRHVDGGSSNAAEQEILALFLNPVYNPDRFGIQLVSSPRHADLLLLTGPLTRAMQKPLLSAFRIMPETRKVVTVGDGFDQNNFLQKSYAIAPLPDEIAARVIANIPGDPPTPQFLLESLLSIRITD